jgi:dethiobiotin synthetase
VTATRGVFVTGTDTGVGKTVACVALLRALAAAGVRAVGMKPVAAGIDPDSRVNADVCALADAGNVHAPLADRNPFAYRAAIAPHLAARDEGVPARLATIEAAFAGLSARADVVVVEGAGGALVPLDGHFDMLDVALSLRLPVVLVVGIRLGCLNHALLSALAIRARCLHFAGWIATRIDPSMPRAEDNVAWLRERLAAPLVADLATPKSAIDLARIAWLARG